MDNVAIENEPSVGKHVSPQELADGELICRVLKGARDDYRFLVTRYQNMIFSLIVRSVGDRTASEELTHEVFVKAFIHLRKFRSEALFSTWLTRIALNHTNSYFTSKRYKESRRTESFELSRHDLKVDGEDTEQKQLRIYYFQKALAGLSEKHRNIITLVSLEGKSYEDAAEILEVPIGTVRSRLNQARLKLKHEIQRISSEDLRR